MNEYDPCSSKISLKVKIDFLVLKMCFDKFQGIPTLSSTRTSGYVKFKQNSKTFDTLTGVLGACDVQLKSKRNLFLFSKTLQTTQAS